MKVYSLNEITDSKILYDKKPPAFMNYIVLIVFSLAGGYTYAAVASVASSVGVGVGIIAGIGAGYCTFAGNEYRQAYNYFSTKSQTSTTKYEMTTISLLGIITGVTYGLA